MLKSSLTVLASTGFFGLATYVLELATQYERAKQFDYHYLTSEIGKSQLLKKITDLTDDRIITNQGYMALSEKSFSEKIESG